MTILIPYAGKAAHELPLRQLDTWTDERVALLKRRVEEGVYYADIAKELHVTKNAAIGKAKRLGLCAANPRGHSPCRGGPRRPHKTRTYGPIASALRAAAKRIERANGHALVPERQPRPAPLASAPLPLVDRHRSQCAFPLEEPSATMLVCGASTYVDDDGGETSWCEYHARIVFSPVKRRLAA